MSEFSVQEWNLLREDIGELKSAFKDVAKALERLARLEERHISTGEALDRSFAESGKLDIKLTALALRVSSIEQEMPALRKQSTWFEKGVYGLIGVLLTYVLKKQGIL